MADLKLAYKSRLASASRVGVEGVATMPVSMLFWGHLTVLTWPQGLQKHPRVSAHAVLGSAWSSLRCSQGNHFTQSPLATPLKPIFP